MDDAHGADQKLGPVVSLNVGGMRMHTLLATLRAQPNSALAAWFSGNYPLVRDEDGHVFIDCDGDVFRHVLEFLRKGPHWEPPDDPKLCRRLAREMDYLCVTCPQLAPRSALRAPTGFFVGGWSSFYIEENRGNTHVLAYDTHKHASSCMSQVPFSDSVAGAAVLSQHLYVVARPNATVTRSSTSTDSGAIGCASSAAGGGCGDGMTHRAYVYDVATDTHMRLLDRGVQAPATCAAAASGRVYVTTQASSGDDALGCVEYFDPGSERWWCVDVGLPRGRRSHMACSADGDVIYVSGGNTTRSPRPLADFHMLDTRCGAWQALPPLTTRRLKHGLACTGGCVYALGGVFDYGHYAGLLEVFDTAAGRWRTAAPLPLTLHSLASFSADGCVFALGGITKVQGEDHAGGVDTRLSAAVLRYNTADDTWATCGRLPFAVCSLVGDVASPGG